jgi:tripartite-type tricarboxylate transporter receptor subunit TctC
VRRIVQFLMSVSVASAALVAPAFAEWPDRPIKLIVPFAAGSSSDTIARIVAAKAGEKLGQQIVVENRVGASTVIGTDAVAKAPPDGYTLGLANTTTHAASAALNSSLPFDPVKDFIPVTTLAKLGFVIAVDAKSPIKTLADLTAHLKSKGGKATYGIAANTGLVSAELYKKAAKVEATKAQYREMGTLMNDMYAGNVDFASGDPVWAVEQVKAGKMRALAVTSATRMSALPDAPTMAEAGLPDFGELIAWWAVFVPANTPKPIVDKLEAWFNQIAKTDETKKFLNNLGSDPFPGNSKMLGDLVASDIKKWAEYVNLAGIEPQ